jgi:hypothetical protein
MIKQTLDFEAIIPKFDAILARGLCSGVGDRDGQMCIEAAICAALDLPHGDNPSCVEPAIRSYKIALNDKQWTSPKARANGMRNLGIAQIGSMGVVDGREFVKRLAKRTIQVLLPEMVRSIPRLAKQARLLKLAEVCKQEGTPEAARELREALYAYAADDDAAAYAADAAAAYADAAADAADAAAAYDADDAAAYAADAADAADAAATAATSNRTNKYLLISASLALEVLLELKSPGCAWIDWVGGK